ncbi:MAG TPA: Fe(3+) ABC transporter substrate-binding protein [Gammaproteobacteria bacterium]|nr:Fe(3+) ABC transporter substrate-binding protein [Gammaproteobacteria bacterium]
MKQLHRLALGALLLGSLILIPTVQAAGTVVVYSARNEQLIKPLFDAYTKETGVKVKFVTGKEGPLLERLQAEGDKTPADMLITVDAGNLWQAAERGVLAKVNSKVLEENIPAHLRDPDGQWYGLSVRARTIVYNTKKVKPADLSAYEDLGNPKWKGRLCLRSSKKVYNQSLVAMMISRYGEPKTEAIVKSWIPNLATDVFSDDENLLDAMAAEQCDVGIVNSYYFGRLKKKHPEVPIGIFWPNQNENGVHVNISGAGITRHAKHSEAALKLLEWLSSDKAQNLFADSNMEFPANPKVKPNPLVASWGEFKHDTVNVSEAGKLQAKAVMLMDRAGYK